MNLLHAVIFLCVENHSAIAGAISACFHLGILLSYLTVLAGVASAIRFLLRRLASPSVLFASRFGRL